MKFNKCSLSFILIAAFSIPVFSQNGLKADFYDGTNFDRMVATRIMPNIDMYWNEVPPVMGINPHECSIRWTGKLRAPKTGTYTFSARVDDGIRVWVGDVKVIDDWKLNDVGIFNGKVQLEEGQLYDLKVDYFNALIEGEVTLLWKIPEAETSLTDRLYGKEAVVIEPEYFSHEEVERTALIDVALKKERESEKIIEVAPKPAPPIATPKKKTVSIDTIQQYIPKNVFFEQAKTTILPTSFPALDSLAGFLKRNPILKATIEGHTDYAGDAYKNVILSQDRANAVADYLVEKGIEKERLTANGYGGSKPISKKDGRKYHPENRRVEFIIE